jgi:hypothetical protein
MTDTKPISSAKNATGCLLFFFGLFAVGGAAVFFAYFLPSAIHIMQARSWPSVPCTIISSKLNVVRGRRSDSYSVSVSYRYVFDGRSYQSNRYQFLSGSSGGRSAKQAIVNRLRPKSAQICFVDPQHPDQAVIQRAWTSDMWTVLVSSLLCMAVGIVPPVAIVKRGRNKRALPLETEIPRGELLLKPRIGPLGSLLAVLAMALFCSGITSIFVKEFLDNWNRGGGQNGLGIFLVPFVLFDLGLFVAVVFKALAFFDPRPQLRLASGYLFPGSATELRWQFTGRLDRISRLRLSLQAREEATFQSGKNSRTATSTFLNSSLFDSTRPVEIQKGKAKLNIPAGTMHTLTAGKNKIVWFIKLQAEITGLPNLNEEFPLVVLPVPLNPTGKSS